MLEKLNLGCFGGELSPIPEEIASLKHLHTLSYDTDVGFNITSDTFSPMTNASLRSLLFPLAGFGVRIQPDVFLHLTQLHTLKLAVVPDTNSSLKPLIKALSSADLTTLILDLTYVHSIPRDLFLCVDRKWT